MKLVVTKKQILKISLIFVLLASIFLCIYSVGNYKTNVSTTQNNPFNGGRNGFSNGTNQRPDSPNFQQHGAQPNENMQPPSDGNMPFQSGNMPKGNMGTAYKFTPLLTAYSTGFLIVFTAAYCFFIYKKNKTSLSNEKLLIFSLLGIGLFLRISSSTLMEGHMDINLFKNWATAAANNFSQFYANARSADYPPLYIYVLYLIGKIASINTISSYYTLLLKLPSIAADIITSYFIYKLAKKYLDSELRILVSAFYIFNPAIFIDSTFWGQVDSFFTLLVVLAVYLLSEKMVGYSAALFTAAVLMKPQGIIFLPVLLFELVRQKNLKNFLKVAASALIAAFAIILPFSRNQDLLWIFKLFKNTISEYPYASVNGFNFFSLLGANYTKDSATLFIFSYHNWGMIFIFLITLFSWFIYIKGNNRIFAIATAFIQIAGVFTFSAGMHERYLFPAVALSILTFIYLRDKRILVLCLGFSATVYVNIYAVLFGAFQGMKSTSFSPVLMITSLLNVLLFAYLVKVIFDIAVRKRIFTNLSSENVNF